MRRYCVRPLKRALPLIVASGMAFAPHAHAAQTSVSYCAGATPSPLIQGAIYPFAAAQFQVGRTPAYRSACSSRSQYIEVTRVLYLWNGPDLTWYVAGRQEEGGWTRPGQYFYAEPTSWDLSGQGDWGMNIRYEWWRRSATGRWYRIGHRTRRFIHSRDYQCYDPRGGHCQVRLLQGSARYGVFIWSF